MVASDKCFTAWSVSDAGKKFYNIATWTDARGTSIQGEMRRGLFDKSSTISDAVGLFVGVILQQDLSKVSLKNSSKNGICKQWSSVMGKNMDKLQLTGQDIFNSRGGHVFAVHSRGY